GIGEAAGPEDRRAARGPGVEPERSGLRSRALQQLLSALHVPVDPNPDPAGVPAHPRTGPLDPADGSDRRPRGPDPGTGETDPGPADRRPADPDPRRLPPGPGALHGEGLRDHRLRGGAGASVGRTADQAVPPARRGGDDPVLPLRRLHRPGQGDGGPAGSRQSLVSRAVGAPVVRVGVGVVPEVVPGDGPPGGVPPRHRWADPTVTRDADARQGPVRAALRAQQPPRLGEDPDPGPAPAPGDPGVTAAGPPRPAALLPALARLHGVQTRFTNAAHHLVVCSPDAVLAGLRAVGAPVETMSDVPEAHRARHLEVWRRAVE